MNRDENPVLDPYYQYYGMWRRPARRSIPSTEPETPLNPPPAILEEPIPDYDDEFPFDPEHEYTDPTTPEHYHSEAGPSYHPASMYSDPESISQSLDTLLIEDQPEPGSPVGSTHSSVADNFDYPDIQLLDDELAEPDDYHYVLNSNEQLTNQLERYFLEAGNHAETIKGQYLVFLSLIKTYQAICSQHSPADWIRTTLYFFPCTRFWARFINELLDDGPIVGVSIHLRYLKSMVRQHM